MNSSNMSLLHSLNELELLHQDMIEEYTNIEDKESIAAFRLQEELAKQKRSIQELQTLLDFPMQPYFP